MRKPDPENPGVFVLTPNPDVKICAPRLEKLPDETHGAGTDILAATEIGNQAPWSQVVSKRQQHRHQDTLQQSVVAAVYIDQSVKKSRESSIIVTGLAPVTTKSDTELFTSLCTSEYNFHPSVASVKRLGRQVMGKTQPLLVHLKQTDQAQKLIGSAKKLRQSADPIIRESVFINPNLTRAEAAAAYQLRAQRRLAHQQRIARNSGANSGVNSTSSRNNNNDDINPMQNLLCSDSGLSPLNPLANAFKPTEAPTAAPAD
jgi:hypothetical protein